LLRGLCPSLSGSFEAGGVTLPCHDNFPLL
jgi:hypothetical protein